MKIDSTQLAHIMSNYSELQDGLFAIVSQGQFVIDTHVCNHVRGEPSERQFFVLTVYEWNVEGEFPEVCNVSFHKNFDFSMYIQASVTIYDTREEMLQHFVEFCAKHNHF